jgi:30S ribosomal protein S31
LFIEQSGTFLDFTVNNKNYNGMGKGDKKSKKGKIANNSYGARRPRKIKRRPTVEEKVKTVKKK